MTRECGTGISVSGPGLRNPLLTLDSPIQTELIMSKWDGHQMQCLCEKQDLFLGWQSCWLLLPEKEEGQWIHSYSHSKRQGNAVECSYDSDIQIHSNVASESMRRGTNAFFFLLRVWLTHQNRKVFFVREIIFVCFSFKKKLLFHGGSGRFCGFSSATQRVAIVLFCLLSARITIGVRSNVVARALIPTFTRSMISRFFRTEFWQFSFSPHFFALSDGQQLIPWHFGD